MDFEAIARQAAADQVQHAHGDLAAVIAVYYRGLRRGQVPRTLAGALTLQYQAAVLARIMGSEVEA